MGWLQCEQSDREGFRSFQFVRPSVGSWCVYGLGTENQNLPGFISITPDFAAGGAFLGGALATLATYYLVEPDDRPGVTR